jgi:ribonuclease HI
VSDGGVHKYEGNYGVVMAQGLNILASTKGKIYSLEFHESSYWSELHGMLAGVVMLSHILKEYSIIWPKGKKVEIYCDNKAVVSAITSRLESRRTVNQHRHTDVDIEQRLVQELLDLRKNGSYIKIQHVKGHQDTNMNIRRELTYEEILNVEADKLTHKARLLPSEHNYNHFPANKVDFILNNKVINSNYPKMVNLAFHSIALRAYYAEQYTWSSWDIDSIWWPVYYQSLAKLSDQDKLCINKFVNNRWPTKYREHKYYTRPTGLSYCLQCKLYSENEDHIIRCRTPS